MKVIILDGGPAVGKTTLGKQLVKEFKANDQEAILIDWDDRVELINPSWIWSASQDKERDLVLAGEQMAKDTDELVKGGFVVIAVGRFFTKDDLSRYVGKITCDVPIFLYHLNVPLGVRKERNNQRELNPLLDLEKDQKERDETICWYGYKYENVNTPQEDAKNLYELVQSGEGILEFSRSE